LRQGGRRLVQPAQQRSGADEGAIDRSQAGPGCGEQRREPSHGVAEGATSLGGGRCDDRRARNEVAYLAVALCKRRQNAVGLPDREERPGRVGEPGSHATKFSLINPSGRILHVASSWNGAKRRSTWRIMRAFGPGASCNEATRPTTAPAILTC